MLTERVCGNEAVTIRRPFASVVFSYMPAPRGRRRVAAQPGGKQDNAPLGLDGILTEAGQILSTPSRTRRPPYRRGASPLTPCSPTASPGPARPAGMIGWNDYQVA